MQAGDLVERLLEWRGNPHGVSAAAGRVKIVGDSHVLQRSTRSWFTHKVPGHQVLKSQGGRDSVVSTAKLIRTPNAIHTPQRYRR